MRMRTKRLSEKLQGDLHMLNSALAYAVNEWLLMFLLFINAFISYGATKIASFFGLQVPCLFCSRLDHILANRSPIFYRELICHAHKLEISSLAYCQIHKKLVDVHAMCEPCLVSFATEKKSNSETYKLMVGKLGFNHTCLADHDEKFHLDTPSEKLWICSNHDLDTHVEESPVDVPDHVPSSNPKGIRFCACCGTRIGSSHDSSGFQSPNSIENKAGTLEITSPCSLVRSYLDLLNNNSRRPSVFSRLESLGNHRHDPLAHVGYAELNAASDSESEVPVSDEDDVHAAVQEAFVYESEPFDFSVEKSECMKTNLCSIPKSEITISQVEASVPKVAISDGKPGCTKADVSSTSSSNGVLNEGSDDKKQNAVVHVNIIERNTHESEITSAPSEAIQHSLQDLNSQKVPESPYHSSAVQTSPLVSDSRVAPPSLANVRLRTSDRHLKGLSEITRPSTVDLFFTPRVVPPSRRSTDSPSESTFSSTMPDFFTPRAFPSSCRSLEALSESVFTSTMPECFTPRAFPSSAKGKEALSGTMFSFKQHEFFTPRAVLSSEKAVEPLSQPTHSTDGEPTLKAVNASETMSDPVVDSIGATKFEGLSRSKLFRPSPLSNQNIEDPNVLASGYLDLNDAYKLAVGSKVCDSPAEISVKESDRVPEDLKLLLRQMPSLPGMSDIAISPKHQVDGEDFRMGDVTSPSAMQTVHNKLSIERNESLVESLDGSPVSEIEGESAVDRLRRQVEYDRKAMHALYKELEEERNASAISANQAMAMITRLQEEKALLHMEALQYQRMMEEQAEYDQEALQQSNELLVEREKEIQDLESELESFRKKFNCGTTEEQIENSCHVDEMVGSGPAIHNLSPRDEKFDVRGFPCKGAVNHKVLPVRKCSFNLSNDADRMDPNIHKESDCTHFEDEQYYLFRCMKNLENRLHQIDFKNAKRNKAESNRIEQDTRSSCCTNGASDGDCVPTDASDDDLQRRRNYLHTIENKILQLTEQLEALELDKNFLEHTINALRFGSDGEKLVQEIAHHLREMRAVSTVAGEAHCS